jgi:methionyl-tRNA formyltransferase
MVWWAEIDSPVARGRKGKPGEVLSVAPLVIATGDGAIELTKTEWKGAAPELRVGRIL